MGAKRSAESLAAEKAYNKAPPDQKPSASDLARAFQLTESGIRKSKWFKARNQKTTEK